MNDQDTYKKNIETYARFSKSFASAIDSASLEKYNWCQTHIGELNFYIDFGQRRLYYHSMDGAMDEVQAFLRPLNLNEISLLFLYGIGAGHHYKFLKAWLRQNPERRLVIIEDNMAPLKMFFHTKIAEEMLQDPQVFLIPLIEQMNLEAINALESFAKGAEARRCFFILLPLYGKWQKKRCIALRDILFTSLFMMQTIHGERLFGSTGIEMNFFLNTARYMNWLSFLPFKNLFEKIPAIIVGGGPSVAAQLSKIQEMKNACLVIAAGSGLNVCNFQGIEPHFIAALDPTDSQATRLLSSNGYNTPMIFRSRLNRRGFYEYHGPKISFDTTTSFEPGRWILDRLVDTSYSEKAGISSTTYAIEIAKYLGCTPIYLAGADLAYTKGARYPEGVFHHPCDMVEHEKKLSSLRKDVIYGKNYLGKTLLTRKDWLIESEIIRVSVKKQQLKIYNLSEEGLNIPDVPFAENIENTCSLNGLDLEGQVQALYLAQASNSKSFEQVSSIFEEYTSKLSSYVDLITPFIEKAPQQDEPCKKISVDEKACVEELQELSYEMQTCEKAKELLEKLREENLYRDLFAYAKLQIDRVQDKGKRLLHRFSDQFSEEERNQFTALLDQVELKNIRLLCLRLKDIANQSLKLAKDSYSFEEGVSPRENAWEKQTTPTLFEGGMLRIFYSDGKKIEEPFAVKETIIVNGWEIPKLLKNLNFEIKRSFGEGFCHVFTTKKGKLHGPSRYYFQDKLLVENSYFNGKKEGMQVSYYPSGALRELSCFKKGKKEGEHIVFYDTGIISSYLLYEKGRFSGLSRLYYPSGAIKRILPFKKGSLQGEELGFYESGVCKYAALWEEGKPKGSCICYYPTGEVMRKNVFAKGGVLLSSFEYSKGGKATAIVKEQTGTDDEQIKHRRIEEKLEKMREEISQLQGPRGPENERFIF